MIVACLLGSVVDGSQRELEDVGEVEELVAPSIWLGRVHLAVVR